MPPIYLDNHATTRLDPRVLEAMEPWLREEYGNPASRSHQHGWKAEEAVEIARTQVAALVGAQPTEIVFTSGATESNNTVLKSFGTRANIVISAVEHKSVIATCAWIKAASDKRIVVAGVERTGIVNPKKVVDLIWTGADLVSVMMANNEVGSIQPVGEIVRLLDGVGFVHSDMAQAVGKIPVNLEALGVHFASFSAHKMYGPKGIGAMYVRNDVSHMLSPLLHGGGQEHGIRSGTLNVPAIVGFGKACEIAGSEMVTESRRVADMRDRLQTLLLDAIPGAVVHGGNRLPGNLNISLPCGDMNAFMAFVADDVSLSLGSACMSNSGTSHVLKAMGIDDDEARRSVRMCVGRFNTDDEIVMTADAIVRALDMAGHGR